MPTERDLVADLAMLAEAADGEVDLERLARHLDELDRLESACAGAVALRAAWTRAHRTVDERYLTAVRAALPDSPSVAVLPRLDAIEDELRQRLDRAVARQDLRAVASYDDAHALVYGRVNALAAQCWHGSAIERVPWHDLLEEGNAFVLATGEANAVATEPGRLRLSTTAAQPLALRHARLRGCHDLVLEGTLQLDRGRLGVALRDDDRPLPDDDAPAANTATSRGERSHRRAPLVVFATEPTGGAIALQPARAHTFVLRLCGDQCTVYVDGELARREPLPRALSRQGTLALRAAAATAAQLTALRVRLLR